MKFMKKNIKAFTPVKSALPTAKRRYLTGFTLIEILVVVAIIGVLAAIIFVSLDKAQARSRDSRRAADMDALKNATSLYYLDKKSLPANVNPGVSCVVGQSYNGSVCLGEVKDGGYMDKFPVDPKAPTQNYTYYNYAPDPNLYYHVTFWVRMEPERYGLFPLGWNCSIDKGWWTGMEINPSGPAHTPGETKMYCTGFETK